jgi:hypothetical protein
MKEKVVCVGICMLMFVAAVLPVVATETGRLSSTDNGVKWEQLPDITQNGTDVMMTSNVDVQRTLADDFKCTTPGPITDVHLWGSWLNDQKGVITKIHLSIHADIPKNQSQTGYSMPGGTLWQMNVTSGQFTETLYHEGTAEWWYDPYTGLVVPNSDHAIYEYDITIDPATAFIQNGTVTKPTVYWLDASVEVQSGQIGWKTAATHWNDDAVYRVLLPAPQWLELKYPSPHPFQGQSIDLAFRITTTPVCCFKVAVKPITLFRVKALVTETCNQSHTNVPWNITVTYGSTHKYTTGTIPSITAGGTATIMSGVIFHFGVVLVTVKVDDCPPVQKRVFFIFLVVIALPG